jgi:hypothetical protein
MSLNFPDNPVDGELYTFNNRTWQWSDASQTWSKVGTPVTLTGPTGETGATGEAGCQLWVEFLIGARQVQVVVTVWQ